MVRLKDVLNATTAVIITPFQFQYGSIKRLDWEAETSLSSYFNSNMVRLKVLVAIFLLSLIQNFNSNMVRLKGVAKIRFFSKNKGL